MSERIDRVTEYRVHGWNPFYDGWLAYVLGLPRKCPHEKNSDVSKEGWYCDETGSHQDGGRRANASADAS